MWHKRYHYANLLSLVHFISTQWNLDFTFVNGPFKMNVKIKEIKTDVATNTKYTKLILYYTENVI
jgi:hypothetical protein